MKTKRVSSREAIPVEIAYGDVLPLTSKILILIATKGSDPDRGLFIGPEKIGTMLGEQAKTIKDRLRYLAHEKVIERKEFTFPDGSKGSGWIFTNKPAIQDEQLTALTAQNPLKVYVRTGTEGEAREAQDADLPWPPVYVTRGKHEVDPETKSAWDALTNLWSTDGFAHLVRLGEEESRRFWRTVAKNARKNTWIERTSKNVQSDRRSAVQVQLAMLMAADRVRRKMAAGSWSADNPVDLFCTLLQRIDPTREEVVHLEATDVAKDMALLKRKGEKTIAEWIEFRNTKAAAEDNNNPDGAGVPEEDDH